MLDAFQFQLFARQPLRHGFAGRQADLAEIQAKIAPQSISISEQVHAAEILDVDAGLSGQPLSGYDGLATRLTGALLVVKIADCAPILFFDPVTRTIAAVHAGRRGAELGIAGAMVRHLEDKYQVRPADLLVGFGPAICVNCYQIDRVKDIHYDLWRENHRQLSRAGVRHIEFAGLCPACNARERFYSYRRDNTTKRNFAFILLNQV